MFAFLTATLGLGMGVIAIIGMVVGLNEVTVGCVAGIIALSKDVLQSDS